MASPLDGLRQSLGGSFAGMGDAELLMEASRATDTPVDQLAQMYGVKTGAKRNALAAGLSSGTDDFQGLMYSAGGAASDALGLTKARDWFNRRADINQVESQLNGRPDLERIEDQSWGSSLPYLGYQVAKQIPNIAGTVAASAVIPEAVVPAALSRGLAYLPKWAGGGALGSAEGFAAKKAALSAGRGMADDVIGGAAVNYAQGVGSLYQESVDGGNPDGGLAALAGGVPYGLTETLPEAMLLGRIKRGSGFNGNLLSRVAKSGASQAATGATSELLQNEMEMAYNGNVSDEDAFSRRLNSGVAGGLVEGVLGGMGGIRGRGLRPKGEGAQVESGETTSLLQSSPTTTPTLEVPQAPAPLAPSSLTGADLSSLLAPTGNPMLGNGGGLTPMAPPQAPTGVAEQAVAQAQQAQAPAPTAADQQAQMLTELKQRVAAAGLNAKNGGQVQMWAQLEKGRDAGLLDDEDLQKFAGSIRAGNTVGQVQQQIKALQEAVGLVRAGQLDQSILPKLRGAMHDPAVGAPYVLKQEKQAAAQAQRAKQNTQGQNAAATTATAPANTGTATPSQAPANTAPAGGVPVATGDNAPVNSGQLVPSDAGQGAVATQQEHLPVVFGKDSQGRDRKAKVSLWNPEGGLVQVSNLEGADPKVVAALQETKTGRHSDQFVLVPGADGSVKALKKQYWDILRLARGLDEEGHATRQPMNAQQIADALGMKSRSTVTKALNELGSFGMTEVKQMVKQGNLAAKDDGVTAMDYNESGEGTVVQATQADSVEEEVDKRRFEAMDDVQALIRKATPDQLRLMRNRVEGTVEYSQAQADWDDMKSDGVAPFADLNDLGKMLWFAAYKSLTDKNIADAKPFEEQQRAAEQAGIGVDSGYIQSKAGRSEDSAAVSGSAQRISGQPEGVVAAGSPAVDRQEGGAKQSGPSPVEQSAGQPSSKPAPAVNKTAEATDVEVKSETKKAEKPSAPAKPASPRKRVTYEDQVRKAEFVAAGKQWGTYADTAAQGKWADLTPEQQEKWRQAYVDGKLTIALTQEIAPKPGKLVIKTADGTEIEDPHLLVNKWQTEINQLEELVKCLGRVVN